MAYTAGTKPFKNVKGKDGKNYPVREGAQFNPNAPTTEAIRTSVDFKGGTIGNRQVGVDGKTMNENQYKATGGGMDQQQAEVAKAISNKVLADKILQQIHEKNIVDQMSAQAQTPEQMAAEQAAGQIGQLTPEQEAVANAPIEKQDVGKLGQVFQSAATSASIGAAGGAATGLGAGIAAAPATAALSVPALTATGAAVGAVGGAIVGTVTGLFKAYSNQAKNDVKAITTNSDSAKSNINAAIVLANKGGNTDIALKQYNDAIAQLQASQRHYKELSKDTHAWETGVKDRQQELDLYMAGSLPTLNERFRIALQKPDPSFLQDMQTQTP